MNSPNFTADHDVVATRLLRYLSPSIFGGETQFVTDLAVGTSFLDLGTIIFCAMAIGSNSFGVSPFESLVIYFYFEFFGENGVNSIIAFVLIFISLEIRCDSLYFAQISIFRHFYSNYLVSNIVDWVHKNYECGFELSFQKILRFC